MISDKVRPHHLERKALLYVRQSSAHQVLHNRESSALQDAMRDRLTALGWSEIEVIDDDLGRSAAGGVQRAGFERMVAEVCLGKVGAVCAREVSRFARNSRDWQQLIEMCRVVDTVLVDQETIYAPRHGNDQLPVRGRDRHPPRPRGRTRAPRCPAVASSRRRSGSGEPHSARRDPPPSPAPATPPRRSSPSAPHRSSVSASSSSAPSTTTEPTPLQSSRWSQNRDPLQVKPKATA